MFNDEKYYLQVEKELKDSIRDEALWSKSMILAKDDEEEARVQYIKARVAQLQKEEVGTKTKEIVKKLAIGVFAIFLLYLVVGWIIILTG